MTIKVIKARRIGGIPISSPISIAILSLWESREEKLLLDAVGKAVGGESRGED
jgi:hypothetical protein